ncbi:MAG: four helix bundle protein [Desulfobulbaceae bacterium]|nr:MAG: four helix bundle protein [Desulfobulbaceae bacterium]
MSRVERFEDLVAWQKARELTRLIYQVTQKSPFSSYFGLRDQIRRAAVSVMSNIAEGFDRAGRAEFHQFLVVAKGSVAEVRSQLYVALDARYIDEDEFVVIKELAEETTRIIGGLRASVQKQRDRLKKTKS